MTVIAETLTPRIELNVVSPDKNNLPLHGLEVIIGNHDFILPYIDVAKKGEGHSLIPFFDPRPAVKHDLMLAGARELAIGLVNSGADVVFTPKSKKSVPMIIETVKIAGEISGKKIKLFVIKRGLLSDFDETDEKPIDFETITPPYKKYMALSKVQTLEIQQMQKEFINQGRKINAVIADDVISRGGTVRALRKVVGKVLNYEDFEIPAYAVIQEFPITWGLGQIPGGPKIDGGIWTPEPQEYNYPAIMTPVIIG